MWGSTIQSWPQEFCWNNGERDAVFQLKFLNLSNVSPELLVRMGREVWPVLGKDLSEIIATVEETRMLDQEKENPGNIAS